MKHTEKLLTAIVILMMLVVIGFLAKNGCINKGETKEYTPALEVQAVKTIEPAKTVEELTAEISKLTKQRNSAWKELDTKKKKIAKLTKQRNRAWKNVKHMQNRYETLEERFNKFCEPSVYCIQEMDHVDR